MKYKTTLALALTLAMSNVTLAESSGSSVEDTFSTTTFNMPGLMSYDASAWTPSRVWNWEVSKHPRMLADVNGDGKDDLVGFGHHDVTVAFGNGRGFDSIITGGLINNYGYITGQWRVDKHLRLMADVSGDGKDDIVAFANDRVVVSLSNGTGFDLPTNDLLEFGYDDGWRVNEHVRTVADVNGDGKQDVVVFADDGVRVALSNGSSFNSSQIWFNTPGYFTSAGGWSVENYPRMMADINGDGKDDIVGFGYGGVFTALSNGAGFDDPVFAVDSFGYLQGWRVDKHPRILADVNGDGKDDIVGFGYGSVVVAISNGVGFDQPTAWLGDLASDGQGGGWQVDRNPRMLADVDGDGMADIIGFGDDAVMFARSTGTEFEPATVLVNNDMGYNQGYRVGQHPRMIGDLNGDGKADIVAIDDNGTWAAITEKDDPVAQRNPKVIAHYQSLLNNPSGTHVVQITGPILTQISGDETNLWGVNKSGDVFHRDANNNQWVQVSGNMKQVAALPGGISASNTVWGIDSSGYPYESTDTGSSWTRKGDIRLVQITMSIAGRIDGIDEQGWVKRFNVNSQTWENIGQAKYISPAFDSALWSINDSNKVMLANTMSGQLTEVVWGLNATPKQIYAVSADRAVVLDTNGHIYLSDSVEGTYTQDSDGWWKYNVSWTELNVKADHLVEVKVKNGEFGEELSMVGLTELNEIPKQRFDLIGIDINGDDHFERVLRFTNQAGDSTLIYHPMAIAYLLKNAGFTLTREHIDQFSPMQLKALAAQPQLQGLMVDDDGNVESYDEAQFNSAVDAISALQVEAGSSGATWNSERINSETFGEPTETVQQNGSVQTYHVTATMGSTTITNEVTFLAIESESTMATSDLPIEMGSDHSAYLIKAENTTNNGDLTTGSTVVVGGINNTFYANDKGFAANKSLTVVGAEGNIGAKNSTHVVAGASVGWGAGMAASWGQDGLYGGEVEVSFVKVGFYITGEDATTAFNESKGWLTDAANDTADWSEDAWKGTSGWFAETADNTEKSTLQFIDYAEGWAVNAVNDGKDVSMNFVDGVETETVKISNASKTAVNTVSDHVDTAIETGSSITTTIANETANAVNIAGSAIESTADTVGDGIIDLGEVIVDGWCGLFGC